MDRILGELFGGDEPDAGAGTRSDTADKPADPERETRHEARQRRKADAATRHSRKEFVERYTTGDPSEGFTTEEAIAHLRQMREEMTPEEFRRAMRRTLEHLPPSQRDDFIRIMREYQAGVAQPAPGAAAAAAAAQAGEGMAREESPPSAAGARAGGDPFGGLLTGLMGGGAAGAGGVGAAISSMTWRGAACALQRRHRASSRLRPTSRRCSIAPWAGRSWVGSPPSACRRWRRKKRLGPGDPRRGPGSLPPQQRQRRPLGSVVHRRGLNCD
jgi:hypothetical protein